MQVEGLPRHASPHASGVVISREPLTRHFIDMPIVRFYAYRWEKRHCEDNSTKMRYSAILAAVTIGASRKGGKVVANRPGLLYDKCFLN
nr:hypothetical protein [Paenibacillus hemerocallicola]